MELGAFRVYGSYELDSRQPTPDPWDKVHTKRESNMPDMLQHELGDLD